MQDTRQLPPATSGVLRRLPAVENATGIKRSTRYRRIREGLFPEPVDLGGGRVAWPADETLERNRAKIAGKTEADIRVLVVTLHRARKDGAT